MYALFILALGVETRVQNLLPVISVDPGKVTGQISPYVYGANNVDFAGRGKYLTFGRLGGNRMTAYNWENNASNAGNDWHFQSDDYLGGGDKPGEVVRLAAQQILGSGKAFLATVPMAGYVAADKKGDGDVRKSPDYLNARFVKSYPKKHAKYVYPPDLTDHAVYQDEFVWWLEGAFATRSQPIFYAMDNEPALWSSTHAEIHPDKPTYQEMFDRTRDLASAVKDVAPKALIFGPVSYGWGGMTNLQSAPDANGRDFLDTYLQAMHDLDQQQGRRLLDVLDVHWYPEAQGGGKRVTGPETDPAVTEARLQAPRSLWDPNYTETSWITQYSTKGPIRLIPRLKEKIAKFYPGTKLAITEYSYGAMNDISGGLAEADALGIFGREGVFAAALWPDEKRDFAMAAFDLYTNFDRKGGKFGDLELASTSADPDVTVYASKSSADQSLISIVLVNHAAGKRPVRVQLGAPIKAAHRYDLTSAGAAVVQGEDVSGSDVVLGARSATLLVCNRS